MCGIVGIMSRKGEQQIDPECAIRLLQNRGPDDHGIWRDTSITLGHTRLSIIDLGPSGHQPMSYQNQRFWITFNGEIYNFIELRQELISLQYTFQSRSDTEVLLAAYANWGSSCLEKLRGMFAFAIWDRAEQTLFLARDRVGEKPLYYWYTGQTFCFASELKALLSLLPQGPEIDPIAIDLYLHYQYVPEPATPLAGVRKLAAAHFLCIQLNSWDIRPQPYWSLEQIDPCEGNPAEMIREELDRAITLTLRSDVPIGIALSGGLDSGAIAALAAPKYKETLRAFSVGYPGHPPYDERKQAEQLARQLKLPFYDIELRTEDFVDFFPEMIALIDEPIADIAGYGHYAVMKLASRHGLKVMLTGIGGDELFWGYPWVVKAVRLTELRDRYARSPVVPRGLWELVETIGMHSFYQRLSQSRKVPAFMRALLQKGFELSRLSPSHSSQLVFYEMLADFRNAFNYCREMYTPAFQSRLPHRNSWRLFDRDENDRLDVPLQICRVLLDTWLVSNCLSLGDRVSMASSVEGRIPLLDYKFIELVFGLRKTQADHRLGHKFRLKSVLRGIVPDELLDRPKRGFEPPVHEWIEAVLRQYHHLLEDGCLRELNIIASDSLSHLLSEYQTRRKHLFFLYKLLVLEIWYRSVVLQESLCD